MSKNENSKYYAFFLFCFILGIMFGYPSEPIQTPSSVVINGDTIESIYHWKVNPDVYYSRTYQYHNWSFLTHLTSQVETKAICQSVDFPYTATILEVYDEWQLKNVNIPTCVSNLREERRTYDKYGCMTVTYTWMDGLYSRTTEQCTDQRINDAYPEDLETFGETRWTFGGGVTQDIAKCGQTIDIVFNKTLRFVADGNDHFIIDPIENKLYTGLTISEAIARQKQLSTCLMYSPSEQTYNPVDEKCESVVNILRSYSEV